MSLEENSVSRYLFIKSFFEKLLKIFSFYLGFSFVFCSLSEAKLIWFDQDSGTDLSLRSITFGGNGPGQFIAVGNAGATLTSPDGVTWTPRLSGNTLHLEHVFYGNDLYIAVGLVGDIRISSDGIHWEEKSSTNKSQLLGGTFGNDTFVVIGGDGAILTSVDGSQWIDRSLISNTILRDVIFETVNGEGLFVAIGQFDSIYTSSDGVDWTKRTGTGIIQDDWYGITYGNGLFVVVGIRSLSNKITSQVLTSSDGISWTLHKLGFSQVLRKVAFGNSQFVAVGGEHTFEEVDSTHFIITSEDGANWEQNLFGIGFLSWDVAFVNGQFFIAGDVGTILSSVEGVPSLSPTGVIFLLIVMGGVIAGAVKSHKNFWKS